VTLPFALLLWDVWPLGRWRAGRGAHGLIGASLRRVGEAVRRDPTNRTYRAALTAASERRGH
jgi:hypothetical protein